MAELLRDNFDSYPTGAPPPGYTAVTIYGTPTVQWSVEDLPTIPSRGLKATHSGTGHNALLKDNLQAANGRIEILFVLPAGGTNRQAGIIARYAGGKWIHALVSGTNNTIEIWASSTTKLGSQPVTVAANTVYKLVTELFGQQVVARVYDRNNNLLGTLAITTTITQAGQWGLNAGYQLDGAYLQYDNLLVTDDTWSEIPSSGTVIFSSNLASSGIVPDRNDLSSSGTVAPTGRIAIQYKVLPVGLSDLVSRGVALAHNSIASAGSVAGHGTIDLRYEVFERPKVTVGLSPVADAFVTDKEPTINYGDTKDLVVGRYGSYTYRSLLRFDLSSLRADLDGLIVSAVLLLHARVFQAGEIQVHEAIGSWDEYGVTWANQPPRHPAKLDRQQLAGTVQLDITPVFLGWYKQIKANNGVAVISPDEAAAYYAVCPAREWPSAAVRPQLLITYYMPEGIPGTSHLPSSGIVGRNSLWSTGEVFGVFVDLPSGGRVSQPTIRSSGYVVLHSSLPSGGTARGGRVSSDLGSAATVSVPALLSKGTVAWRSDLQSQGYVYARYNLPSGGYPRVEGKSDLASAGYAELPHSDVPSSGSARLSWYSDLPGGGRVTGSRQDLPSSGTARSQWLRSYGVVLIMVDLSSKGVVSAKTDLQSQGYIYYTGVSDLPAGGWPRIRAVSELLSTGYVRSYHRDLPCQGHVGPWTFELVLTMKLWPPAGRSIRR